MRGIFSMEGSNRVASVAELAAEFPGELDVQSQGTLRHGSYGNGCHACEVEIDPETGGMRILRYVAVDDFGTVVNAASVRGQVQGGVAQGLGQALMECAPDPAALARTDATSPSGYALPRAADVAGVEWTDNGLASRTNLFGAKACGESGVSAAPPAVMNAIADALKDYPAVWELQVPARPADIWRVIHG